MSFFGTKVRYNGRSRLALRNFPELVSRIQSALPSEFGKLCVQHEPPAPEAAFIVRVLRMYGTSSRLMRLASAVPLRFAGLRSKRNGALNQTIHAAQRLASISSQHIVSGRAISVTSIARKVFIHQRSGQIPVVRKFDSHIGDTPLCRPELIGSLLREMERNVLIHNDNPTAAWCAATWLALLHPLTDGNGRVSRIVADSVVRSCHSTVPFALKFIMQDGRYLFTSLLARTAQGEDTDDEVIDYLLRRNNLWRSANTQLELSLNQYAGSEARERRVRSLPGLLSRPTYEWAINRMGAWERGLARALFHLETVEFQSELTEVAVRRDIMTTLDQLTTLVYN